MPVESSAPAILGYSPLVLLLQWCLAHSVTHHLRELWIAGHEGTLSLDGLTELFDAAAKHLANHADVAVDNLPASAAKILRDAGHGE